MITSVDILSHFGAKTLRKFRPSPNSEFPGVRSKTLRNLPIFAASGSEIQAVVSKFLVPKCGVPNLLVLETADAYLVRTHEKDESAVSISIFCGFFASPEK